MMKTLFGTLTGGLALGRLSLHGAQGSVEPLMGTRLSTSSATDQVPAGKDEGGKAKADAATPEAGIEQEKKAYAAFLATLGLVHLKTEDILAPHFKVRGKVHNSLPPRELWTKMVPTLRVADKLHPLLNCPLVSVISAYRSPAYNAACSGSATHSCHMQNLALDLEFACAPSKVVQAAEQLRASGHFQGGIGRYPGFTHVDTRGFNADW